MRSAHNPEKRRRHKAARLGRKPTPYQQWRAGAWCVTLRGRKRRAFHRKNKSEKLEMIVGGEPLALWVNWF